MDVSAHDLNQWLESGLSVVLVDVREPFEHDIVNIGGLLIPMRDFPERIKEIEPHKNDRIVVYCRSGARSGRVVHWLRGLGYSSVWNLGGGILAWRDEVDPSLPTY